MQRITKAMLQNAVNAYVNTLMAHELLDGPLQYQPGRASLGVPWSIRYVDGGTSPVGVDLGVLGYTSREAYDKLHTVARVLADIKLRNETL